MTTSSTIKSVKLSEDTYKQLVDLAGKLQSERKKPVSIEDAIKHLLKRRISHLAGSWEMDDDEIDEFNKSLDKMWSNW